MTGLFSQSITWPLEYIKMKRQINKKPILENLKFDFKKHGFKGYFRGFGWHIGGGIPRTTLRFATFDYLTRNGIENKLYAGFISGIIEASLIYTPTEYMKIQAIKNNSFDIVKNEIKKKPTVLYQGLLPTILRTASNQAITFKFYDTFSDTIINMSGDNSGKLITGSLGGITAVLLNNPIDVTKTRMQADNTKANETVKNIVKSDGILGFWKGALVRSSRMAPLYSLNFYLYDYFKNH